MYAIPCPHFKVPPLSEEVVIPPDITAARATTYIVDSSLRVQDELQIEEEIRKVHELFCRCLRVRPT